MSFILETSRFILREFLPEDAGAMFELNADQAVLRFTGDAPFESVEKAREFIINYKDYAQNGMGRWAVQSKNSGAVLGWCGLKLHPEGFVDLGYRLQKKYWNKGYATEAAKACLKYGFEQLKLKEIVARSVPKNESSIRIMEKCGMTFSHYEQDELHAEQIIVYKITHEDFSRH